MLRDILLKLRKIWMKLNYRRKAEPLSILFFIQNPQRTFRSTWLRLVFFSSWKKNFINTLVKKSEGRGGKTSLTFVFLIRILKARLDNHFSSFVFLTSFRLLWKFFNIVFMMLPASKFLHHQRSQYLKSSLSTEKNSIGRKKRCKQVILIINFFA